MTKIKTLEITPTIKILNNLTNDSFSINFSNIINVTDELKVIVEKKNKSIKNKTKINLKQVEKIEPIEKEGFFKSFWNWLFN